MVALTFCIASHDLYIVYFGHGSQINGPSRKVFLVCVCAAAGIHVRIGIAINRPRCHVICNGAALPGGFIQGHVFNWYAMQIKHRRTVSYRYHSCTNYLSRHSIDRGVGCLYENTCCLLQTPELDSHVISPYDIFRVVLQSDFTVWHVKYVSNFVPIYFVAFVIWFNRTTGTHIYKIFKIDYLAFG